MNEAPVETQPGEEGPVTVSIARKVLPGKEAAYEQWISDVVAAAAGYPGHMGASVLRPTPETDNKYVIIYRFDTYAHCRAWEGSAERQARLAELEGLVEGEDDVKSVTGLEFWFDLPEVPAAVKPSPHKMALTLTVVVYLMLSIVQWALSPVTAGLPDPVALFIVVAVQVVLLTYVVMPRVTQLLKGWLYA